MPSLPSPYRPSLSVRLERQSRRAPLCCPLRNPPLHPSLTRRPCARLPKPSAHRPRACRSPSRSRSRHSCAGSHSRLVAPPSSSGPRCVGGRSGCCCEAPAAAFFCCCLAAAAAPLSPSAAASRSRSPASVYARYTCDNSDSSHCANSCKIFVHTKYCMTQLIVH